MSLPVRTTQCKRVTPSVIALLKGSFCVFKFQIIPFLALGLGVDDMFLLAHTFAEHATKDIPLKVSVLKIAVKVEVGTDLQCLFRHQIISVSKT